MANRAQSSSYGGLSTPCWFAERAAWVRLAVRVSDCGELGTRHRLLVRSRGIWTRRVERGLKGANIGVASRWVRAGRICGMVFSSSTLLRGRCSGRLCVGATDWT